MKTNIIHVLIIAIILIAGWSLFTVLQDFYNNSDKYDNYYMMGKGRQYLPLAPENYSSQRKYPVYKAARQIHMPSVGVETIGKSNFVDVEGSNNSIAGNSVTNISWEKKETTRMGANSLKSGQIRGNAPVISSNISRPFSKGMKINTERDIADASGSNNISKSSTSESSGMMRVFGNDEEGDDIEGGGGIDNENFYNDVPVGDGIFLLIFMTVLYCILMVYRNRHPISIKITRQNKLD
ncbi:MAG: hypothetical protein VB066_02410 [Paludibacter sp.]|nr:hypothetical protein [Paludibacter sp.]